MSPLRFGMLMLPLHRRDQNPTLQLFDDLDLVVHLDRLGFEEVWFGEHHSGGLEIFASPELMVAAAAQRTTRIKLGTGVNSLPYHHPFILADRWVMLTHLTRGRAMFGCGPGALPSDAWQMGLDVQRTRENMEVALEAIMALLGGEGPVTRNTDWFRLRDARLQLRPFDNTVDVRVAALTSPAGPRAAGRFGLGLLSVAATTPTGFEALKDAWKISEQRAEEYGTTVDRSRWSIVAPMHLAETEQEARRDVGDGMGEWLNYYKKLVPLPIGADADDIPGAIKELTEGTGMAVIGTPDMAITMIERLVEQTGGFGSMLIQSHDWADREATRRSFDLFARYVAPHFQGQLQSRSDNQEWVMQKAADFKAEFAAAQDRARREHEASKVT